MADRTSQPSDHRNDQSRMKRHASPMDRRPSIFADFSGYAHNLRDFVDQDPIEFYIRAKYDIARADRGLFPEVSPSLQMQYRTVAKRLENLSSRHETLSGLLRGRAPAEELRQTMVKLGLPPPREGESVVDAARRYRDETWGHVTRLSQRLQRLETRMASEGALIGKRLDDLRDLIVEIERSGIFQTQFPELTSVNKSSEAFVRLIERRIEGILETQPPEQHQAAIDKLIQTAKGAVDRKSFENMWLQATMALHREEYQHEPAFEHRREFLEEDILALRTKETERHLARQYQEIKESIIGRGVPETKASRIARERAARQPDRYEEMLIAFQRTKDLESKGIVRGYPDLESLVGRFIFRKSERGGWQPLEVLRVESEGLSEPRLIVRPYSLSVGRDAELLLRTTPEQLLRGFHTNLLDEILEQTGQEIKLDFGQLPGTTSTASPIYAIWDDLERHRREIDRRVKEHTQDVVRRKFLESYLRHGELEARVRPVSELIEDLLGFKYAVSGSRLGLDPGIRIPYRYFEVMRKHFPFLLYGQDAKEILSDVIQEATAVLYEGPFYQRLESLITQLPEGFRTHREWFDSDQFNERLEQLVSVAIHQARGRAFSAQLSHVSGRDSQLITALEYLRRGFREGAFGQEAAQAADQLRMLRQVVTDLKSGRVPVPTILEPLVKASEQEIYHTWRLVSSGAGDRPLSLTWAAEKSLQAEERLYDLEQLQNRYSTGDVASEITEAYRELRSASQELQAYAEYDPDSLTAHMSGDVAERVRGRRRRPPIWRPPKMSHRYDQEWNRLINAYVRAVYNRSDAVPDPERLLSKKNVQAYFLAVAERILGRKLSEDDIGYLLQGGLEELYGMARYGGPIYVNPSVRSVADIVESGVARPDDFFIRHEGKLIASRYAGTPELNQSGARFVIPSTGAVIDLYRGTAASPMEEFPISASQLKYYDVAAVHPFLGSGKPLTGGWKATLKPPVHPRLVADMGYSVADVLEGILALRSGGTIGAIDIETTGLLEDYEKLGLQRRFLPTEIGFAKYRIQGPSLELLGEDQLIIRPLKKEADWIRRLAGMSEEEFVRRYAKGDQALEAAARSVYQQTLRGYASLVAGPSIRDASQQIAQADLSRLALEGLKKATREGVYLSQALTRLSGFMQEVAGRDGWRHVIAANAMRAEAKWLSFLANTRRNSLERLLSSVVWHDPQPVFRLLNPNEQLYRLSHIAQRLGLQFEAGQLHTALYDAKLTAQALSKLLEDQRLDAMLEAINPQNLLHEGQVLLRVHRGERSLWEVGRVLREGPGAQPVVRLRKILGEPAEIHRSGASMGDIEQSLYGQFIPIARARGVGMDVILQRAPEGYHELPHALSQGERSVVVRVSPEEAARIRQIEAEYWMDRARRDVRKAFSSPSSPAFQLMLARPGSEAFQEALDAMVPRWASEEGVQVYRSALEQYAKSAEGKLHRRFFRNVQSLLDEGLVDHRDAAKLLASYYNNLREIRKPVRRLPLELSRFRFDTQIPGVGVKSLPLASIEATHRALEDIVWSIARAKATHEPAPSYYGLALSELRRSVHNLLPPEIAETATLYEMAQALHDQGRRLWEEGKILAEDPLAGFLPDDRSERRQFIRQAIKLQDDLLKEQRSLLEQVRFLPSGPRIQDWAVNEVLAFLRGEPSAIPIPEKPEELKALQRTLWRDVTRAAFDERHKAFEQARAFLGLDSGRLEDIRLPFPVGGEYGVRLGDVTVEEWPEVKRWLRRSAGLEPGMRRRIMEFWAQRLGEQLRRSQETQPLAAIARQGRRTFTGPRGLMWAGVAGAAALGLYAVGRANMQRFEEPQTVYVPPQMQQGLEIEIQAMRNRPVDIQAAVNAATAAIQTSLGIPLNVNVHQVDDTRSIDQRWAQEVVAQALRG